MKRKKEIILILVSFGILIISNLWFSIVIKDDPQVIVRDRKEKIDIINNPQLSEEQDLFIEWFSVWDSGDPEDAFTITLDSAQNIYVAGWASLNDISGLLLLKFDKNGNYIWNTTWTTESSSATSIAIDSNNNIYLGGNTISDKGLLIKFDGDGNFQWEKIINDCEIYSISIDSSDNIFATGEKLNDVYLIKFNSSGGYQWDLLWGEASDIELAHDIAIDSFDYVYLVGKDKPSGIWENFCILKYDNGGVLEWNRTWGTPGRSIAYSVAIDSSSNVYVQGVPTHGVGEWCILKYDTWGNFIWNKNYSGPAQFEKKMQELVIDSNDNLFILNWRYLYKCNNSGELLWSTNTPNLLSFGTIALDNANNVYYAGNNYGHNDVFFAKYSSKPKIIISTPQMGAFFGHNPPSYELIIYEPDLDYMWYSLDEGIANNTFTGLIGQIIPADWDKLGHGIHTIRFYANDTYGNEKYSEVEVVKDIEPPHIGILEPTPNTIYEDIPPNYSLYIHDLYFYNYTLYDLFDYTSVWYSINGTGHYEVHTFIGIINANAWASASYGDVSIKFYASDLFGNEGVKEVIVEKRRVSRDSEQGAIPGYNTLVILCTVGILLIILIEKEKKNSL